jgi:hypothetical protein
VFVAADAPFADCLLTVWVPRVTLATVLGVAVEAGGWAGLKAVIVGREREREPAPSLMPYIV